MIRNHYNQRIWAARPRGTPLFYMPLGTADFYTYSGSPWSQFEASFPGLRRLAKRAPTRRASKRRCRYVFLGQIYRGTAFREDMVRAMRQLGREGHVTLGDLGTVQGSGPPLAVISSLAGVGMTGNDGHHPGFQTPPLRANDLTGDSVFSIGTTSHFGIGDGFRVNEALDAGAIPILLDGTGKRYRNNLMPVFTDHNPLPWVVGAADWYNLYDLVLELNALSPDQLNTLQYHVQKWWACFVRAQMQLFQHLMIGQELRDPRMRLLDVAGLGAAAVPPHCRTRPWRELVSAEKPQEHQLGAHRRTPSSRLVPILEPQRPIHAAPLQVVWG